MANILRPAGVRVLTGILFVLSLAVYSTTVCPTVSFTDNGELAAVATTLGIAHPTGYPLFSLLGRVAAILPVGGSMIAKLNFTAAIVTALAVCLLFHVLLNARRAIRLFGGKEPDGPTFVIACFLGAAAFAFSETVWSQATALEVYGLHLFLILTTMLFFVRGLEEQLREPGSVSRSLLMFAFVLGLSFSNHMTTVLLAPGFVYLYYSALGFSASSHRRILRLAPLFLLALSVYAYLPIRSAGQPPADWGHPVTWERLLRHVSGSQYRVWMFSGAEVMRKQLSYVATHFFSEYHIALLPLIALGWWASIRRVRRLTIFLHVLLITTLLYASNYDIFDIDSYFLTAYIVTGWFISLGVEWVGDRIRDERKMIGVLAFGAAGVIALQVVSHHRAVNESDNVLVEDYVHNVLDRLPSGTLYMSGQWDYTVSPLMYYQTVEGVRTDVSVVDKNLLMNRTWYFIQLERNDPGIFRQVEQERDAFLDQLIRFERGEPFNPQLIQERWDTFLRAFLRMRLRERPVAADLRIIGELPHVGSPILDGLSILFAADSTYRPEPRSMRFRPWRGENVLTRDLKEGYVSALIQQAVLDMRKGDMEGVRKGVEKASEIDPSNRTLEVFKRNVLR